MGRFLKLHWLIYCILVFAVSRAIMFYTYNIATYIMRQHTTFFNAMCKWDCKWYLTIINHGYDLHPRLSPHIWKGLANWAFFPLYPYTVKVLVFLTHFSPVAVGTLLNQLIILACLSVFYLYLRLFVDELNSRFGVILLAFSPFSIYFASIYTEASFLLLSLTAFYFMRTRHPLLSAMFGGLLSATRIVGVMFSIPYFYNQFKKNGLTLKLLFCCLLSVSGLLLYMFYLQVHAGDYLAFEHIQKGWGRKGLDLSHLGTQLWAMISDYHNSILFLFSMLLSVYLFCLKFYEEAMFNVLCILPGVMTGAMMSEGRFSGTLFTFYFGIVIAARKSNSMKIVLVLVFFLFYISYFLYWLAHADFLI